MGFFVAASSSAYPLWFPAHGEDLPFGHYWKTSGVHSGSGNAHDFTGKRYDFDAGTWHDTKPTGDWPTSSVLWGQRIYAGAAGTIVGCWREYPDWSGGNEYPANNHRQTVIGNHLAILTDDGYLISYGHLKNLSIPSAFCPNGSADGWLDTLSAGAKRPTTGTIVTQYLVPERLRVRVNVGTFLGNVGHSGNSSGPHLHLQAQPVTVNGAGEIFQGSLEPIQFRGALYQSVASPSYNDWSSLNHTELNPILNSVGEIAIWPNESRKISVSSRGPNLLDIFDVGSDRQLRIKSWNGSVWSGWSNLGGTLTSSPACTSWASNRIDCFARGQNLALYHKYWTSVGGWSSWSSKGGVLASGPTVTSRGVNRLDVFIRGTNNQLYQKMWTGSGWSSWMAKGGELHSSPACVSSSASRLDCFARGTNRHLIHKSWTSWGGWQDWVDRGGILISSPSVSSRQVGHLDVFVRGQNRAIYTKYLNSTGWHGFFSLGGVLTSAPVSTSWNSDRIDLFALGQNRDIYQKSYVPSVWFGWHNMED